MARTRYTPPPAQPETLTPEQTQALALLLAGSTDAETAQALGLDLDTVWAWTHDDPLFMAELNRRRDAAWGAQTERLRGLVAKAIDVLAADLAGNDPQAKRQAAIHVLRAVGLYGADLRPAGKLSAGAIKAEREREALLNFY